MPDLKTALPNCTSCGVCCLAAGEIAVQADDDTPRHLTRSVRRLMGFASWEADEGIRAMKRATDGACIAFRGEINKSCSCSTYERRPWVCSTFEAGSEDCLDVLAQYHRKPSQAAE